MGAGEPDGRWRSSPHTEFRAIGQTLGRRARLLPLPVASARHEPWGADMSVKRTLTGGAAVLSAGVLPFVVSVPAAGADDYGYAGRELDFSFVNPAHETVTCHITA